MKHMLRTNRGFTLVEFILYFGLSSILLVIVASLFLTMLEARSTISSVTSLERDGQFIMARLQHDVRRASSIANPATIGESGQQLQLDTATGALTYQVVDQVLVVQRGEDVLPLHVDTRVESFVVTRIGAQEGTPSVRIELTIESPTIETTGQRSRSYVTTIGLR